MYRPAGTLASSFSRSAGRPIACAHPSARQGCPDNHQGQFPTVTLSFNLALGVALGEAVGEVDRAIVAMHLPATLNGSFQVNAKAFRASTDSQPGLILDVHVVLGILHESYIHPLTILSASPWMSNAPPTANPAMRSIRPADYAFAPS